MTARFKSTYSEHDAFYARADLLRPGFGNWDCEDPVAQVILDLVEAQNEIADAFDDDAHCIENEAAFTAAVEKRHAAGKKLLAALVDRASWPEPRNGSARMKTRGRRVSRAVIERRAELQREASRLLRQDAHQQMPRPAPRRSAGPTAMMHAFTAALQKLHVQIPVEQRRLVELILAIANNRRRG